MRTILLDIRRPAEYKSSVRHPAGKGPVNMETRKFERVEFVARTFVESGSHKMEATLGNISLKGAMVQFHHGEAPTQGSECSIEILLNMSEVVLHLKGTVIHT